MFFPPPLVLASYAIHEGLSGQLEQLKAATIFAVRDLPYMSMVHLLATV
jgi:hypothetical protein